MLLQQAAERMDAAYTPKPGEQAKGREILMVKGMFGTFALKRQYYCHPGKKCGHFPADAALGLEGAYTPALARLICLEGADETGFLQASFHLAEIGGISVSERQVQRVIGRTGECAVAWQKRESAPAPARLPRSTVLKHLRPALSEDNLHALFANMGEFPAIRLVHTANNPMPSSGSCGPILR